MIPTGLLTGTASGGRVWRIVENQEQAATRNITASAGEQSRLERLLDDNKPAYLPGTEDLHWLLKTPFRYPPLRYGSRFGSALQPGILYGARERETAMTESAVYLWLFRAGPLELGPLEQIRDGRTALRFRVSHRCTSDLTGAVYGPYTGQLSDPASYAFSQAVGSALREVGVGMIWFYSARASGGINCAAIDPAAVRGNTAPQQEHWRLQLDSTSCWWGRPGEPAFEVSLASVSDGSGRIPHPMAPPP